MVKNLPASAGDTRDMESIPGLGRSPGEGNGNRILYPCLKNPMDTGVWPATVHRVAKSQVRLKQLSMHTKRYLILLMLFVLLLIPPGVWGGSATSGYFGHFHSFSGIKELCRAWFKAQVHKNAVVSNGNQEKWGQSWFCHFLLG